MISALGESKPITLSAVAYRSPDRAVGLTAGHALRIFGADDEVSYFPDGVRTTLGSYAPPPALGPAMDLGAFDGSVDQLLDMPLGFARIPKLLPVADVYSLADKDLVFVGGQTGKHSGTVIEAKQKGRLATLFVKLDPPELLLGDSGGPLYFDDGTTLFLAGTLVRAKQLEPGETRATFFHPGAALEFLKVDLAG